LVLAELVELLVLVAVRDREAVLQRLAVAVVLELLALVAWLLEQSIAVVQSADVAKLKLVVPPQLHQEKLLSQQQVLVRLTRPVWQPLGPVT
jgi:hypothetical protein